MRPVERILFVRTDRMGDLLMNLPAIHLLRQEHPKSWLTLLADKSVAPLLEGHPDIDEVMGIDVRALKESASERRALSKKLRDIHYDLAVISNADRFFHQWSFFAGIPVRVGWKRKWAFFLNRTVADDKATAGRHEIDSNLLLIGQVCRRQWDGTLTLGKDAQADEKVRGLLSVSRMDEGMVAIHPFSSNPAKQWPVERFVDLCRRVQTDLRMLPVIIGGDVEAAQATALAQRVGGESLVLAGKLSLKELAALFRIGSLRTLVSVDSGPVHVAWMSGKPVVAMYAKNVAGSNPDRWGPRDTSSQVIYAPIADISVEQVWQGLNKVLSHG